MPEGDDINWGRLAGQGLNIAIGVGLGYLIGNWLDKHYGWENRGVLIGVSLGFAGGMYLFIKDAIRSNKD